MKIEDIDYIPSREYVQRLKFPECTEADGHVYMDSDEPGVYKECILCEEKFYLVSETQLRKALPRINPITANLDNIKFKG